MPTFLSDPPPALYLVLVVVAVVTLVVWYRTQTRRGLLAVIVAGGVLGGLFLVDTLCESPREEAVRRVHAMIDAINARALEQVMPHVSERFDYHGANRASFRNARAWGFLRDHSVRLAAWDFSREYVEEPDPDTVTIGFMAKGQAPDGAGLAFVRATFRRDPDGARRLTTFTAYEDPLKKATGSEFRVPNLP